VSFTLIKDLAGEKETLRGYARGLAGGLLFGTPLICTMEMWWLGFTLSPERLLIAIAANFLILIILERYSGFRGDESFPEQVQDAIVAQGLGLVVSVLMLGLIHELRPEMSFSELLGKVIMQTIAVSIGISVAISQLGQSDDEDSENQKERKEHAGFWGNQAIAVAGAVFFGLNVAATEEPMMIGLQMREWQTLAMLCFTLMLVFAITYALDFRGEHQVKEGGRLYHVFLRDSVATAATALLCATALLVLFGYIDADTGLTAAIQMIVALGFATGLGAAAARLLI
jgi:putative integral membrane protein (TIGR02587 family)